MNYFIFVFVFICVDIVRMSAHVVKTSSVRSLLMSSNYESFEFDFESLVLCTDCIPYPMFAFCSYGEQEDEGHERWVAHACVIVTGTSCRAPSSAPG